MHASRIARQTIKKALGAPQVRYYAVKPTSDVPPDTSNLHFDLVGSAERRALRGMQQAFIAQTYSFMQDVPVTEEVFERAKIELEREKNQRRKLPTEFTFDPKNYYKSDILRMTDEEINLLFPNYKQVIAEFIRDKPLLDKIGAEKLLRINREKYDEANEERCKGVLEWAKQEALKRKASKK